MTKKSKPKILAREIVAQSRLMRIEALDLEFSNGQKRQFERLKGSGRGAVLIVPILNAETILLIREYAAGLENYQLGFPKGLIDPGETPEQAALRELQEEVGYGARQLTFLREVTIAPSMMAAKMHLFVAHDLYPSVLPGDEPEPLEVLPWPIQKAHELILREDFSEARSITALLMMLRELKTYEAKRNWATPTG